MPKQMFLLDQSLIFKLQVYNPTTSAICKIIAMTNVQIQGLSPIAILEDYCGKQEYAQTSTY